MIALIYNWWSLFVRLAELDKYYEAIVSRPLPLLGVGKQTSHASQKTSTITSTHGRAAYERVCAFFNWVKECEFGRLHQPDREVGVSLAIFR